MAKYKRATGPRSRRSRKPYAARGGIKTQSKQGSFGTSWWGKKWLTVFEASAVDTRLARGRTYARSGQVVGMEVAKGKVTASIQGSKLKPYEVSITVKTLTDEQWEEVLTLLAAKPSLAARLLAGDPPEAIEEVFAEAGTALFPNRLRHIKNSCECTDWSNPCKHSAAVYYLLCEQMDADPFILFTLRGKTREELVESLSAAGATAFACSESELGVTDDEGENEETGPKSNGQAKAAPLPSNAKDFWAQSELVDQVLGDVYLPSVNASLVARLGPFPFWRGEKTLQETVDPLYRSASMEGLEHYLAEKQKAEENSDSSPLAGKVRRRRGRPRKKR